MTHDRVLEVIIHLMDKLPNIQKGKQDINSVTENLANLGYTKEEINAALIWVTKKLEAKAKNIFVNYQEKTFRILHQVEQFIISPDAFGYLVQMKELGLIDTGQMEDIIEIAMRSYDGKDVSREDIQEIVSSILFDPDQIGWDNHTLMMSSLFVDKEIAH